MAFSLSELLKYGYFNFFTHKQTLLIMLIGLFALQFAASQVTYRFGEDSEVLRTVDGRIRGARDRKGKDFVFGGLFPIHSDVAGSGGAQCGEVRRERGLERMEAMLFAVDHINSDPNILSGIELGYDVRDTCNSENIGLDETIDLIITGSQLDIQSCQSDDSIGVNGTDPSLTFKPPTSGIIGAAASRVSVPIASLVRLFQVPQVSYASSSAILSNRDRYEYFYRTIPPDNQQARAMIDVLLKFRWTYVSTIYSRNPYGEPGIVEFRLLAAQNGICIDLDEGIEDSFGDTEFDNLATSLIGSAANVVIVFASQDNAQKLLSRISITPSAKRFTWIASDAWARSINVVHQFNETAAGLYGFAPLTEHVSQFQDYFSNLTIDSNNRNPWFPEFYSAFVGCSLDSNATVPCATNQSVTELSQYAQGNFIPLVVDAVYTYAHALDNFLNDSCQLPIRWDRVNRTCVGQTQALTGSILLDYISQVDFVNPLTGDRVVFDKEGNVEGRYEILNYQAMDSEDGSAREYFFTTVGVWDGSALNDSSVEALTLLNSTQFQFGISNVTNIIRTEPQISQCGTCKLGQFRRIVQSSCCGICEDCLGQSFSNDSQGLACLECESEFWGNNPLEGSDSCVPITETFIRHSDAFSVIVICLAILGLIVVIATSIVYFIFWKTPVVKSSGREQMITLLIGIGLSFILAFVYVSPPVPGVCAVQRVGFWFCYSLMFGALLIKIVRVTRIFYNQKGVTRVRFTEPYFQIIFTFFIVLGQVIILIVGLIVVYPEVVRNLRTNRENQDDFPEIVVSCVNEHIAILILCAVYETLLIVLSTILGVLSFKYPENFNEAKFVSFCTFIIAIVWAAFVGLYAYFAVEERQEIQNAITGLATVLSAFAVLACLFGPKLFIIIFRPSQNTDDYSRSKVGNEFHSSIDIPLGSLVGQRSSMHFGTSGVTASTNIDGSVVRDDYKTRDSQKVTRYVPPPQLVSNNMSPIVSPDHITVTSSSTSVIPNQHTHTSPSHNPNVIAKTDVTPSYQTSQHVSQTSPSRGIIPNNHTHITPSHDPNIVEQKEDIAAIHKTSRRVSSTYPVQDNSSMPGSRKTSSAQPPSSVSAPNSRRQSSNDVAVSLTNIRLDPPTNTSRGSVSSISQQNGRGSVSSVPQQNGRGSNSSVSQQNGRGRLFSGRNVSESGIDMGVDGRYSPVDKTSRVSVGAVEL